jgi:hypothetical protein
MVSGPNPQALGSIATGTYKTASWVLSADQAGNYIVPVDMSSVSYGETLLATGSFPLNITRMYLPVVMRN